MVLFGVVVVVMLCLTDVIKAEEKEKFRYRNRCLLGSNMNCGMEIIRNDTLIVATPWDCCPMTSYPYHCMSNSCPPPPLNRKCVVMEQRGWGDWECCPKYFCEENATPESCQMKRLDPMCMNPPAGKMNCVGFKDPHGCCTKYQCQGEGKPGMCPMENRAMQMQMRFNTTHQMMNQNHQASMQQAGAAPKQMSSQDMNMNMVGGPYPSSRWPFGGTRMEMECIGDSNCPDAMKCCSNDMSVYGDNHFMMRNMHATQGYCQHPVMMAPINA